MTTADREQLIDAATALFNRGWQIIPTNGKKPCDNKGVVMTDWQKLPVSLERIEAGVNGANQPAIGVILGPRSGIIDIESDSPAEEKLFAELFNGAEAPITPTFQSKRGKHRLYRWDERFVAVTKGWIDYKNGSQSVKLGCRLGSGSKGAQSVLPPSPDREWLPELSPHDVDPAPLPEVVIQRLIRFELSRKESNRSDNKCVQNANVDRAALTSMLTSTKNMDDSNDGSKRLYVCACRAVDHGLSDSAAIKTIRVYEAERPFPKQYKDAEIRARIRDAEREVKRGSEIVITNVIVAKIDTGKTDNHGKPVMKSIKVPKSMDDIIREINTALDDWPRRVDNVLFVHDREHGLAWFDKRCTDRLFGYLKRRFKVDWRSGPTYVTQGQLFAELERTGLKYKAIEKLPHEPPIPEHYYLCDAIEPGDGTHLRWLLDRFRPETTIDRDLILAALMTPLWGGPAGCRPTFVITADEGRGAGKSVLAQLIAHLYLGYLDVSIGESIDRIKERFLSPEGMTKRIAIIDNVKSMKVSCGELESLITTTEISGKRMYVGEGQRPNTLTWFLTLNGVSLATDLAQRSVVIKIVKGKNEGGWYEETVRYIDKYRTAIIGDLIAQLRAEPTDLPAYSRWATWEDAVLRKLPEPSDAQRTILERQNAANCELDEADVIETYFAERLRQLGYEPQSAQVRIPVAIAADWYGLATGDRAKTIAVSRKLNQMHDEDQLKRLAQDPSRTYGRCFVWTGVDADVIGDQIQNDLRDRICDERRRQNY